VEPPNEPGAYDQFFEALGLRLRELRKRRDWSQDDMGRYGGFSPRHWQQLERGERHMNLETLLRIARIFETTPARLLQGLEKGKK
jgi:transcriptional regulator with XRE-family HTH domain